MSNESDKVTPDTRDAKLAELTLTLTENRAKLDSLQAENRALTNSVRQLEGKLKNVKSAPTGDVVYLEGQAHAVVKTVRANSTFDEVKKGHVEEGATLVVIAQKL